MLVRYVLRTAARISELLILTLGMNLVLQSKNELQSAVYKFYRCVPFGFAWILTLIFSRSKSTAHRQTQFTQTYLFIIR